MVQNNTCKREGHYYGNTTSDLVRKCEQCKKVQIKYQDVWIDEPKEPVKRKPEKIEESQLSLL